MTDHVVALTEAVRLARLELSCYRNPECAASAEWTVNRLAALLEDPVVTNAISVLAPDAESPSIVPAQNSQGASAHGHDEHAQEGKG
jgi:hypothetical protein